VIASTPETPEIQPWVRPEKWKRSFEGWHITACSVRNRNFVQIIARESLDDDELHNKEDVEIRTRSIQIRRHLEPESQRTAHQGISGFSHPIAGSCNAPIEQDLVMSLGGDVYASGSGRDGMEHPRRPDGRGITPNRLVNIGGFSFAIGKARVILKRADINRWDLFPNEGLPELKTHFERGARDSAGYYSSFGFADLDGPNESLLYAVGGKGDVWRFDGKLWHQCDFPSNEALSTVTVAPDGNVYITGEGGSLWIGAEDTWRLAAPRPAASPFNDSVWFDDRLWLCSDYQLKVWNGEELVRAEHEGDVVPYCGHMDSRDGLLLIAGGSYAHCFDGQRWQCLVAPFR
jgi:hypothetical protein